MAAKPPRLVVLAAGASTRLGQPKALAPLPLGTPLERLLRAMRAADVSALAPLLITGRHDAEIRAALRTWPQSEQPSCHFNPDWAIGRTSSVLTAARHAPGHDLLIAPVDHPRITSTLFRELSDEWCRRGAPATGWLAPGSPPPTNQTELRKSATTESNAMRPGHPIVIGRDLLTVMLNAAAAWQARALRELRKRADPLWMWPVTRALDALAIHENLDTPADFESLSQHDAAPLDGPKERRRQS